MLQQYLPLAVLKLLKEDLEEYLERKVATVLTACGIETVPFPIIISTSPSLQQYLPLAVLKPIKDVKTKALKIVATVLTACGIETHKCHHLLQCLIVATVLTACGIETHF